MKTYWVWKEGPWDLPNPVKPKVSAPSQTPQPAAKPPQQVAGSEVIVSKNLFDPERGASKTKEAEAEVRAIQRIRSMVLLGTAILGTSRYAVVQEADGFPNSGPAAQGRPQTLRRLKIGDMVEGFNLSEISDKKVVFIRGPSRVEVPVDFFRKVEIRAPAPPPPPGQVGTPAPPGPVGAAVNPNPAPPVVPNVARRPRLPAPPSP